MSPLLMQFFYDELNMQEQDIKDNAAQGRATLVTKRQREFMTLYELLATNSQQKAMRNRRVGVNATSLRDFSTHPRLDELSKPMKLLTRRETLARIHAEHECTNGMGFGEGSEDVNCFRGGFKKPNINNDLYSNTNSSS